MGQGRDCRHALKTFQRDSASDQRNQQSQTIPVRMLCCLEGHLGAPVQAPSQPPGQELLQYVECVCVRVFSPPHAAPKLGK